MQSLHLIPRYNRLSKQKSVVHAQLCRFGGKRYRSTTITKGITIKPHSRAVCPSYDKPRAEAGV